MYRTIRAFSLVRPTDRWEPNDSMILMRLTRKALIIFLLSWIAFQLPAATLYAEEDGRFYIQPPKLGLGGYYRLEDEDRQTAGLETTTTHHRFRESMTIDTNGWIYHPELMDFHLAFEPELQQESFHQNQEAVTPSQSYDKDTTLLDYDLGATLLKHKPVSMNLFANRKTGQIDFSNAQDSDIDSQTLGSRLNFNNATLPASIAWIHRKLEQSGFYQINEDRDEAQITIRHNAQKSATQLNLNYDDTETAHTTFKTTDISAKTLSTELTNGYSITDDNGVRLDSRAYYLQAEYNDIDQTNWNVSENLFWTHSKNLLSRYRAEYNRREFDGSTDEEERLSAALTHHYLDRLTTDVGVAGVFNKFDGGREDLYESNLGLLYRRPIPNGSVELGADYDYSLTNRSGTQKIIPSDERLALSTGTDTFLGKEDIDLASIVVTDLSGATVYTENIDYQVDMVGSSVRISRTLLGAIAEGQQVVVHYSYQINAAYDDARFGQRYRLSLALWSFARLAYTHSRIDQSIRSGEPPNDPLHDSANTVRLSFVTKWSDTQFLFDQQDRSNDNSSITRSATERINLRPARNFYLTLTGSLGDRDFTDLDQVERFYSLGSSVGWTPQSWCNLNLVYQRDSITGDQRDEFDTEMGGTFKVIYGIWTASLSYRLRDQEDRLDGNSLKSQEVIVQFTRHLW
jgi:hypothetical protein